MKIFERIFGRRIADQITPQSDREYNDLLLDCIREVTEKNAVLDDRYGIGHYEWDLDQEIGDLVFSDNGMPKVKAKVVVAGTYSLESGTWLWGWANTSILNHLTNDALRVKTYGELHGISDLVERKMEATEDEAWGFAALSCRILDGNGVYRGPAGNAYVFMIMTQIEEFGEPEREPGTLIRPVALAVRAHMRITWRELAVNLSGQSSDDLLSEWRWLVPESMSLLMVSTLGDAFLQDSSGKIYWLDIGGAELSQIAESPDHFDTLRQQPELANRWFSPQLVGDLLSSGHVLKENQCFSYKIPLTLGGAFQPDNFEPCNLSVHFCLLGQIQSQVKDLPVGTPISSVKLGE